MASYTGKQIITIHILPNISKSRGIQTMTMKQISDYETWSVNKI